MRKCQDRADVSSLSDNAVSGRILVNIAVAGLYIPSTVTSIVVRMVTHGRWLPPRLNHHQAAISVSQSALN